MTAGAACSRSVSCHSWLLVPGQRATCSAAPAGASSTVRAGAATASWGRQDAPRPVPHPARELW